MIELELFQATQNQKIVKISPYNICGFKKQNSHGYIGFITNCIVFYNSTNHNSIFKEECFDELIKYTDVFTKRIVNGEEFYINEDRLIAEHIFDDGRVLLEFPYEVYIS